MRRAAVAALLLVAAGCGSSARSPWHHGERATPGADGTPTTTATSASPTTPARLVTTRCADLVVLGLRGQGQSARTHQGVGHEVQVAVRSLVRHLHDGRTVRLQAVRFPAVSAATEAEYDADIAAGVALVRRARTTLAARCPGTSVALAGFSEGAQVAHRAAQAHAYALVLLMGDPLRNPRLSVRTLAFGIRLTGRGNAGYGAAFADPAHVVEACVAGDNVCNAPLTGRVGGVSATHRQFYERPATARVVGAAVAQACAN
ncbi:cutinase family protein [Nocardioides mangrovicus]|uniref:Cutinase family protein n=1 Tax=Nocardioides mangrovicus TaxID=2478913 RepID=A0A3L8NZT5_9ACTN|nr:cutinase family protein [Nocardioides mangrovicus]RLV48291.1 cutinase family protein [Nocardioides mangrovicus]